MQGPLPYDEGETSFAEELNNSKINIDDVKFTYLKKSSNLTRFLNCVLKTPFGLKMAFLISYNNFIKKKTNPDNSLLRYNF